MTKSDEPHTPLPPAVADRLGFLLGKLHLTFVRQAQARIDTPGITGKHYGCLTVLLDEGPMTQQRLGERMGVDRTTVVSIVDALEEQGFVERKRNPDDRRAYALHVTRKGREWQRRVTKMVLDLEREFLAALSADERRQLREMLQRVLVSQPAELLSYPAVEVRPG